jgi:hypothetical protein
LSAILGGSTPGSYNENVMKMKPQGKAASAVQQYFHFARRIYGEDLLENFLLAAVISVLLVRLYLYLTGYPQIGFGGLHISHMLVGGLLMLTAIFMALGFLSRPAHEWAAIFGGIGFGVFIDELGKYLTQDNDYFFRPAVAIIYVTFVLIYLAIRTIFSYRPLTRYEKLANAFEIVKQGSINGLSTEEEQTVINLIQECGRDNPLAGKLSEMLPDIRVIPSRRSYWLDRFKQKVDTYYQQAIAHWWFAAVVIAFFAFAALTGFSAAIGIISSPWNWVLAISALIIIGLSLLQLWKSRFPNLQVLLVAGLVAMTLLTAWVVLINPAKVRLPFADWVLFASSSVSGVLIIAGIVFMARSRLQAYQMFHRAILVSIMLTTVFAFYEYQFYALIGVFLNFLILFALRYVINREKVEPEPFIPCP